MTTSGRMAARGRGGTRPLWSFASAGERDASGRGRQPGGTLSGGEQQMLAVARALMSSPTLLLHADRAYILEGGRITMEGPAEELRRDPRVIQAYLGP